MLPIASTGTPPPLVSERGGSLPGLLASINLYCFSCNVAFSGVRFVPLDTLSLRSFPRSPDSSLSYCADLFFCPVARLPALILVFGRIFSSLPDRSLLLRLTHVYLDTLQLSETWCHDLAPGPEYRPYLLAFSFIWSC